MVKSEVVRFGAKLKRRHHAECSACGFVSHHYAQECTAELIMEEHRTKRCRARSVVSN